METTRILTILVLRSELFRRVALVLALGLMVCSVQVSQAEPMGTAFTYQGHLYDNNSVADDYYDFQFKLYDSNSGPGQIGSDVNVPDVDVIDGYFTVELDFGSDVFDGNAVWLEIGIRPGEQSDPCAYTPLVPRQEVTPAPYALHAKTAGAIPGGIGGIGTTNYIPKFTDSNALGDSVIYENAGNVGIGTTSPGAKLDVIGSSSNPIIKGTNSGSGYGVQGETSGSSGRGVLGYATGSYGRGVYGYASNTGNFTNYGGYFTAAGSTGLGVYGYASNTGAALNFGGYFHANGSYGRGVYGYATGSSGKGVYGWASNTGNFTNYGGYFLAEGSSGRGVFGQANNTGAGTNYGGYFTAAGSTGQAVHGYATNSGTGINYGGWFQAAGSNGRGVHGYATNTGTGINYGGYFTAAGSAGQGVYGKATGSSGRGVYGEASASSGTNYGVYGRTNSSSGYAGYFVGGRNYFSGNVGIGMTSPAKKLDVDVSTGGQIGRYQASVSGNAYITVDAGTTRTLIGSNRDGIGFTGTFSNNDFAIRTNNVDRISVTTAGNVGIGITNPSSKLEVKTSSGYGIFSESSSSIGVFGYSTGGWGSGAGVYGQSANWVGVLGSSSNKIGVYGAGGSGSYDFYAAGPGTNYGASSSIRWKSDIRAIDDPLAKVTSLRGVYFTWDREHGGAHDVGMVAEEVGEVLPEIVEYEEDGVYATGMDYSKLTPLLVEAVKALKIEADEREKQHAEKDTIIERLQQENQALSKRLVAIESLVERLAQQRKGLNNEAF